MFDGLSLFADDQANFVGRDKDLLDGAVAVHVAVEAGAIPTLFHDLVQQSLGQPVGIGRGWGASVSRVTFFTIVRRESGDTPNKACVQTD